MKSRKRNKQPYNATWPNEGHVGNPPAPCRKLRRGDLKRMRARGELNMAIFPRQRPVGTGAGTSCIHNTRRGGSRVPST